MICSGGSNVRKGQASTGRRRRPFSAPVSRLGRPFAARLAPLATGGALRAPIDHKIAPDVAVVLYLAQICELPYSADAVDRRTHRERFIGARSTSFWGAPCPTSFAIR